MNNGITNNVLSLHQILIFLLQNTIFNNSRIQTMIWNISGRLLRKGLQLLRRGFLMSGMVSKRVIFSTFPPFFSWVSSCMIDLLHPENKVDVYKREFFFRPKCGSSNANLKGLLLAVRHADNSANEVAYIYTFILAYILLSSRYSWMVDCVGMGQWFNFYIIKIIIAIFPDDSICQSFCASMSLYVLSNTRMTVISAQGITFILLF